MPIKRGPPLGVQIVFILATMLAFFYGYTLYNKALEQLEDLEKRRGSLVIEKEDLLRDIRSLKDKETDLTEKLSEKSESFEKMKNVYEELQETYDNFKAKKDADIQSFQSENKHQLEKIKFLSRDLEEVKSSYEKQLEDFEYFKSEASKKMNVKEQECQNDIATIKDELANCMRKLQSAPTMSTKKTQKIPQEVNKEAEDQKLQIAEPVDKGNSSMQHEEGQQGGLLKGQNSVPQAEQLNPPNINEEGEEKKGERSQGEGGFHEGGNKEGQIKAPEGREEGAENKGEESEFKPPLPDAADDGDNIDKKVDDFNDGEVDKEKSAIEEDRGNDDENVNGI